MARLKKKAEKKGKKVVSKEKAEQYLKEYTANGFNKTKALHSVNKDKAQYESNHSNSTAFHKNVMSSYDIPESFKIDKLSVEWITHQLEQVYTSAESENTKLRALEMLGRWRNMFKDTQIDIRTNVLTRNDIASVEDRLDNIIADDIDKSEGIDT